MARRLSGEPCKITFHDRISGSKITLFYRMPTTQESVKYTNTLMTRRGNKVKSTAGETRQKFGALILTGFPDSVFETENGPLSSDPKSKHYDENWKQIVKKHAPDIIEGLAMHVFENSLEVDEDTEVEDTDPLDQT